VAPAVNTPTYRQIQAQQTRDRIAEAARRLFAARGYRATSMEAIAAEAGVAARTVYSAFGAKREILSAICERWLEQADARGLAEVTIAEPDPRSRLHAAAHWLRALYEAGFDVVTLFAAASDEDAETRALLQAKLAGRNQVMDAIIASLDGTLRVPVAQGQAIYRALAAPGVYGELVVESGWSPDAFEEWVAHTLVRELLEPAPSRPGNSVDQAG
jgi:AcrR family transcriptional regulator